VLQNKAEVNESEFNKKRLSKVGAVEALITRLWNMISSIMHASTSANEMFRRNRSCMSVQCAM